MLRDTALRKETPFPSYEELGILDPLLNNITERAHEWIQNLNQVEEYELNRACSAFKPNKEKIYQIAKKHALRSFQEKNEVGITHLQYLDANPSIHFDQRVMINRYVLEMLGEEVV